MSKDIIFFLSMLGWFNGIILSMYFLFFSKEKSVSNRLFGFLLLLLSIRVGKSAIWWFNPDMPIIFIQIGLGACFMIGPVLYFYLQAALNRHHRFYENKIQILLGHGLITILVLIFLTKPEHVIYWKKGFVPAIYFYWLITTIFSGFLIKDEIIQLFKRRPLTSPLKWILSIYLSLLLLVITYTLSFLGSNVVSYIFGPIILSLIIYLNILLFVFRKNVSQLTKVESKYQIKIDDQIANDTMDRMNELMQQHKLYINIELKIADVASKLDVTVHQLSQILNDNFGTNFTNYVNQFRINYAKDLIKEKYEQLTLEAIGNEAGFNSKTSFFTLFKKHTGMTPNEYKEHVKTKDFSSKL